MTVIVVGDIYGLVGREDELDDLMPDTQQQARDEPGSRPSDVHLHRTVESVQLADAGPMDPRRAD